MSNKRPLYCWDSCVFLAHFKSEADKPLADIRAVASEIDLDRADLLVSITTVMELLDVVSDKSIAAKFEKYLKRPNVALIDVNWVVAQSALNVRVIGKRHENRNIKVADAQIIATAIIHKADVLHTFDPKLLIISGHEIVSGLSIKTPKPLSGQMALGFKRRLDAPQRLWPSHLGRSASHPPRFARPTDMLPGIAEATGSLAMR